MQLRVSPDDIASVAARLAEDGPALHGVAALQAASRGPTAVAARGHTVLATALDDFLQCQRAAFSTLAETVSVLAGGLSAAAAGYRDTETRALGMLWTSDA